MECTPPRFSICGYRTERTSTQVSTVPPEISRMASTPCLMKQKRNIMDLTLELAESFGHLNRYLTVAGAFSLTFIFKPTVG